jgi:hypothetical protein
VKRRPPAPGRKRRTREHVIADLGVNHVERQALLCGFSVERVAHDYGIDLIVLTYDDAGEVERGPIFLQVKATDTLKLVARGQAVAFRVQRRDLRSWLTESFPVILVVYDASTGVGYWLYIQAHLAALPRFNLARAGETITLRVPVVNVIDPSVVRLFASYRDRVQAMVLGVVRHDA